ncbi:hypothetical protein BZA05DRAFT_410825 [Tricharina praecox]|uniref:uncharacterized protein n=1 Tax=Tricharina praecox TaxID=43433 RepID=UPI00221E839A|nr:uncharacterized protein BZA05DRAFT_410825 [Tricharina praecox]KAI5843644.1 hypothetical protein BZA05DRAFT_410825 [Tricharina praecox]
MAGMFRICVYTPTNARWQHQSEYPMCDIFFSLYSFLGLVLLSYHTCSDSTTPLPPPSPSVLADTRSLLALLLNGNAVCLLLLLIFFLFSFFLCLHVCFLASLSMGWVGIVVFFYPGPTYHIISNVVCLVLLVLSPLYEIHLVRACVC